MSGLTSAATSKNKNENSRILRRLDDILKLPVSCDWLFQFGGNGGNKFKEAQQKTAFDRVIHILRQRPARRQRRRRVHANTSLFGRLRQAVPTKLMRQKGRQAARCLTGILIGSLRAFALNRRMWLPDIQSSGKRNCP